LAPRPDRQAETTASDRAHGEARTAYNRQPV